MNPIEVNFPDPQAILPGAQFGDAFQLTVHDQGLDPLEAARRAVYRAPSWVNGLLWLRNKLVKPFKLKPGAVPNHNSTASVGMFPIIQSSPDRLILGLDDRHLDFRLLVDVVALNGNSQAVRVSTVVKTHNALGRMYLMLVKPFHKIIVPVMLRAVEKARLQ